MSGIALSEMDLSGYEERELGSRSNVEADIAEVIATGCAMGFEWNSSQVAQARKLIEPEDGKFHGSVTITQLGHKAARKQKVRGGKTVSVERYKRELVAVKPVA